MRPKMQILLAVFCGVVFMAFMGGIKYLQIREAMANQFTPPPEAVTTVKAEQSVWQETLSAVGSLVPVQGTMISAEEAGKVVKVGFESGASVKAGDLLIEIDTAVEEGNLQSALSRLERARRSFNRSKELRASNAISAESYDLAEAQFREAEGQVQSIQGQISKKKILAPFSGKLGIRRVNVGQYVVAGTPLVPLQALDPLYVNFSLPQQTIGKIAIGQTVELDTDVGTGGKFTGKITAINPQVESATRNFEVQATVANPAEVLRPGMFVKARVLLSTEERVIALPSSSIAYAPYGDTVYVVETMKNPEGMEYLGVRQQVVTTGVRRGDLISVLSGIKPGDEVVSSGWHKLRPGAAVKVNNNFAPGSSLTPNPADS